MASARAVLLAASALAVLSSAARAVQDQPAQTPTFRTEANYVRVDVFPTADGAPIADLRQEDFEVREDGVVQRIDAFEHVVVRGPDPTVARAEPNTVAESRSMLENPRARVFVLFLDLNHVDADAAKGIQRPLVDFLNRAIGPDDLLGVMTPEMSAADVTFARRMDAIEGILTRYWWGERNRVNAVDPRQELYKQCYPGFGNTLGDRFDDRGVADEMIRRYHERETLGALDNLVRYLWSLREGRKAVITITNGWLLYRPDAALARPLGDNDGRPRVGIDPSGRLATSGQRGASPYDDCERDRQQLAQLDSGPWLRRIVDLANRANATFYPVDPRGLAVFDTSPGDPRTGLPPKGSPIMAPPALDAVMLRARTDALRDLAVSTDGLAVVNSNDLDAGLRRVTADLSSYYLLAYYSTGKFDGAFHSISVRVKRPGVQVRARRGYLAPTPEEVKAISAAARPPAPAAAAAAAEATAIASVVGSLAGLARDLPLRLQTAVGWTSADAAAIVVVGEVGAEEDWKGGADADVMLLGTGSDTIASARAPVPPGSRVFRASLASPGPLPAGAYTVQVRVRPRSSGSRPVNDAVRITVPAFPAAGGAVYIRQPPGAANRESPTSDLRFRRTESLRLEILTRAEQPPPARLLDRTGQPLPVPVAVALRDDADGTRWLVARLALAPLAAGDYVIEINRPDGTGAAGAAGSQSTRTLHAFRVVP